VIDLQLVFHVVLNFFHLDLCHLNSELARLALGRFFADLYNLAACGVLSKGQPYFFRSPSGSDPTRRGSLFCSFQSGDIAVLRPIAVLPFVKFEAPEPRRFARRMGNGLVDATDMPSFKEDVVAFRLIGVGIALQDEHCSQFTSA